MTVYVNSNRRARDYECTNVIACVALTDAKPQRGCWEPSDESALTGLTKLWREGDFQYYGYL
jgi:hypothetical protein